MTIKARSIPKFCQDQGISVATFYRNKERMPRIVKIGHQSRILDRDEEEWAENLKRENLDNKVNKK